MGKPLRIAIPLTATLHNSEHEDSTTHQSFGTFSSDDYDEFTRHTHTCIAHGTLARVSALLANNSAYRIILHQKTQDKSYGDLLQKHPNQNENSRLEVPGYRVVKDLEPIRTTPRLNVEDCSDDVYLKRHEKYERQEKFIKRRDRIRQREEQYRLHLMKAEASNSGGKPKIESIEVVEKKPRLKKH